MTWRKPIPPEAKMVFKGTIFEVWQWEQIMFDGSKTVFERLRRSDAGQVIVTKNDLILVLDQSQPDTEQFVSLPGGRFEEGEEPLEAVQRELLEETGHASDDWELLQKDEFSGKIEWSNYTYIARNAIESQAPAHDAGEEIVLRWVSFDNFLLLADDPQFRSNSVIPTLLRARLDPIKKEVLRKKLFG